MEKALDKMTKKQLIEKIEQDAVKSAGPVPAAESTEALAKENADLRRQLEEKQNIDTYVGVRNITPARIWLPDPIHLSGSPEDANKGRLLQGYKSLVLPAYWLQYYIQVDLPSFRDHECVVDFSVVANSDPNLAHADIKIPKHWKRDIYTDEDIKKHLYGDRTALFKLLENMPEGIINRFLENAMDLADDKSPEGMAMASIVTQIETLLNKAMEE